MKTIQITTLMVATLLIASIGHAQKSSIKSVKINKTAVTKVAPKSESTCKKISTKVVSGILRNTISRTLKITLDRDNASISMMGKTRKFKMPEKEVQGPARKWKYFIKDVNSFKSWSTFEKTTNKFYLFVEFEGNGSEIKGTCPGCLKRFRDSRAPDLNWEGKRIAKIQLSPIAYENSIAFEVDKVELAGKFDLNGPAQYFLPSLVKFFENKIKDGIEKQARIILNSSENKKIMAEGMRGTVELYGLRSVSTVEITNNNLYICQ